MSDIVNSSLDDRQSPVAPNQKNDVSTFFQEIKAQATNFFSQPAVRRGLPVILTSVVVGVGVILYLLMIEPAYVRVYSSLPDAEKSEVISALNQGNFDVRIDETSGSIEVAADQYHAIRMHLASQGLPKAAPSGYDKLDNMPLGTSRSMERARLKQSQELEIAKSILQIKAIRSARVILGLPKKSPFIREEENASASVLITLHSGRMISDSQVQSIVHLVSSAVPGLLHERVTVIDQSGNLLSTKSSDSAVNRSNEHFMHQLKVEQRYRERILSLLAPIVGIDGFTTEVNVELDFTVNERTSEKFDPEAVLRSEQVSNEQSSDPSARGIPGALANEPPEAPRAVVGEEQATDGTDDAGTTLRKKESTVRNYEIGKEVEVYKAPVGKIVQVAIAVALRDKEIIGEEGDVTVSPFEPEEIERLENLIKGAIGYKEDRGDTVIITSHAFNNVDVGIKTDWFEEPWVADLGQQLIAVLVLLIVVFGGLRPFLKRAFTQTVDAATLTAEELAGVDEAELVVGEGESLEDIKARLRPKQRTISSELLDTANTYDDKVALIRMLVTEDLGRVSNVLKTMMRGEMN